MGELQGEEENPGHLDGFVSRSDSTPSNSIPVVAHAHDEPLEPSDTTVTPGYNSQSSSIIVAADAGDKPLPDGLWVEAYNSAKPETRKWIDRLTKRGDLTKSTQIEDLIGVVRDIEKGYQDHALRIRVGEKDILWKSYAPRVISFLNVFRDIENQLAIAPIDIVWSALKAVLQVSVVPGEELAAILGCSEKILSIMRRGEVYEAMYINASTPSELLEDLKCRLVDAYTKSLDLLAHMGHKPPEGYVHILLAIVNPGEATGIMANLMQSEKNLVTAAHACEAARSADTDERFKAVLNNLGEPLAQIDDRVHEHLQEAEEDYIRNSLEFFSGINVADQHRTRAESRALGTGEWLLQHEKFQEWEQLPASAILWLHGAGGIGKSFLASKVIDRFLLGRKSDQGLAYFYCARGRTLQDPLSVLQSFVCQLSTSPRYPKMRKKSYLKRYHENRKNCSHIDFDACKEYLLESVNLYPQTIIVLDGLDECEPGSRGRLLTILADLVNDSQHPVKIFISSRREEDVVKLLPARSTIEIDAENGRDDIQIFIEERMDEMGKKGLWGSIPDILKSEIKSTLCKGSDGMFRWAYLQMEQLSECHEEKAIRNRLGKLPTSLNDSYDELFSGLSSHDREMLQRAAIWLMCAFKPLPSNELLGAVRLSISADGETQKVEEELTEETLRSICRHLIAMDSQQDEWRFQHVSVIEYFEERHEWTLAKAHSFVAKHSLLCLTEGYSKWDPFTEYRHYANVEDEPSNSSDPQHPLSHLQEYVRRFWYRHVNALEHVQPHDAQLSRLVKRFMGVDSSLQESSQQYLRWHDHEWKNVTKYNNTFYPERFIYDLYPLKNPIFGVCVFGFHHILEDWWMTGIDISQLNEGELDLLSIASKYGHQTLCEKLIGLGADVNRVLNDGKTSALYEATETCNINMVRFLLDNKADPNIPLKDPILCQSIRQPLEFTAALLEAGANPDVVCEACRFSSPLEHCGYEQDYETAALLLQYKANVDFYTCTARGMLGSPLVAATAGGSLKLVRLLVEHGADVNAPLKHGRYRSALVAAGTGWAEGVELVKYFIEEAGADVGILSSNPPPTKLSSYNKGVGLECGKYLKENGHVVDEDVLRRVGMWP
ncbi:hypothetical protein V8C42DRAFT_325147 [Trichoderma barbatum]